MSEQFTMPRKLAHELLGALFNGPSPNPAGYEALKQDFAARMRAAPTAEAQAERPDPEALVKSMHAIARQLMNEQVSTADDDGLDEFRAGKMAGIIQLIGELIKHVRLSTTPTPTTERN